MVRTVQNTMTKNLITIQLTATIQEADHLMDSKNIRHLVVMDESGTTPVGIVSKRNFVGTPELLKLPVEAIMRSPVCSVPEDTHLKVAITKMLQEKISSLVVTNEEGAAVGIVTTEDLLKLMVEKIPDEGGKDSIPFLSAYQQYTIGLVANQLMNTGI